MNEFLAHLAGALNLPQTKLSPGLALRDLPNWDSLAILTTISTMDEVYGILLSGPELQDCRLVDDLFAKIMEAESRKV